MVERIERQALYELVWSEPMRTIAARFGVSDVALKKACQRASVPTPDRGYWAKREAGRPVPKVDLPPRSPGHRNVVQFKQASQWYPTWTREELAGPVPPPPVFPEPMDAVRARVESALGTVKCPTKVARWHPTVQKLLTKDEDRRKKAEASPYGFGWDEPVFSTPVERRRMRILNALFLAVGRFEGKVTVRGREARDIAVTFDGQHVVLELEVETKAKKPASSRQSERLRFSILRGYGTTDVRETWIDDEDATLEQQLTSIAVTVVTTAEAQLRDGALYQHQWRIEQKARIEREEEELRLELARQEIERRKQEERMRLEALLQAADNFRKADDIRAFVGNLRARADQRGRKPDAEFDRWAAWALGEADRVDPSLSWDVAELALPSYDSATMAEPGAPYRQRR